MDRLRVLVVDDEIGMCQGIERALRNYTVRVQEIGEDIQFDVDKATTGTEALAAIERISPHLILLDYKLPDMLGSDILEKLKVDKRTDMLVIMITAFASIETAVATIKRGAYDFLAKPFTPEELRSVVQKAASRLILQKQAQRFAEEKRQIRFQFISVLAHELKSPLNAIEGYLNIIRDRTLGDEVLKYDRMVERCVIRIEGMRKLILDLLDMTRIESGQKKRVFEEFDLREIANESIEMMLPDAKSRGITISLEGGAPAIMTGVRDEMSMMFNNLISNAVKYNKDDGEVNVTIVKNEDAVNISVADTGVGMTSEETSKIFDDFVRIKNSSTKDIMGSGLGLSIVKKLVSLYGGDISVESTMGEGSAFAIHLRTDIEPENTGEQLDAR